MAPTTLTEPSIEAGTAIPLPEAKHRKRIQPKPGWVPIDLAELWEYRELFYFFAWRDIKVRYKQTVLGAAWAVLQPVTQMVVFTLIFGRLAEMPSEGVPYPLFNFVALLPWNLFSAGVNVASMSLLTNAQLVRKVYFPRIMLPTSSLITGLVDFAIAFVVLVLMMVGYGLFTESDVLPTWRVLCLPLFLLLALLTTAGFSLWTAAINVYYRDVRYILPYFIQTGLFVTPVLYPSSLISEGLRPLYALNPMVGVVEGFRWSLLNVSTSPGPMIAVSAAVALLLLVSGAYFFRRMEKQFADMI